ncbi:TPA: phage tail protein [Salmonella enterica]|nr:phage tail protein [Salmonella enterica]
MTIAFDTIPGSIRKPGVYMEFNTRMAVNTLPGNEQTLLIIAPMLPTGSATPLNAVGVFSDDEAGVLFGYGSLAHLMAKAAIDANAYLQLQVIGLEDDAAGVAATGTLTLTGPATGSGTLSLWVGNTCIHVAASTGDTADMLYQTLAAAVNAEQALPVTASVTSTGQAPTTVTTLTLTARQKGAWGNDIVLQTACTAPGVTTTLSAMTGGAVNPDIQPALDAVFAAGHHIIAIPWTDQPTLQTLREHLKNTGNAMEQHGAVGVAGWPGSLATGTTLAGHSNDGRTTIGWHPGSVCLSGVIAAAYAAVIASEEDPARPLNTLALAGLDITAQADRAGRTEQENALHNGLTPFEIGPGDVVQIVRAVTTYTKNAAGVDEPAMLDLTTIRTLDYTRKACRQRIALRFPREKLRDRTREKVRSELLDVLLKLDDLDILENVEANKDKLRVERNGQDANRLDAVIPADVVNGLHVFAGRIDLYL